MVDYVDLQHAMMLSNRLERFKVKKKSPYHINFRCVYCGDSQTSKTKARAWLLEDKYQSFRYFCHNCGESHSFAAFLKSFDTLLYNQYVSEKFIDKTKEHKDEKTDEKPKPVAEKYVNHLKNIKKISQLKFDHPAKEYILNRKIPSDQHYKIYYAPKFKTWVNSIIPDKFKFTKDEPRIILPFLDKKGNLFGLSARGFDPDGLRYITIMIDERPKIFGLNEVDFSKRYYVLEGSIDSLFLDNAIAMAGADGNTNGLENVENAVFVFDLEYRNKEIMKRVEKIIDKGLNVCLLPKNMAKHGKDINEFVLNGVSPVYIQECIDANIYKGLSAKIRLAELKNC
jgi:transcription elongation factor Elf1